MIHLLEGTTGGTGSLVSMLIVMVPLFLIMYFLMIRPQKKQEKQTAEMRNSIMVGDEISTIGGIIGRVCAVKEDILTLEINKDRTKMKVYRWAVREIVNPMPRPGDEKVPEVDEAPEIKE